MPGPGLAKRRLPGGLAVRAREGDELNISQITIIDLAGLSDAEESGDQNLVEAEYLRVAEASSALRGLRTGLLPRGICRGRPKMRLQRGLEQR